MSLAMAAEGRLPGTPRSVPHVGFPARAAFLLCVAAWLLYPLASPPERGIDGAPVVAAGRVANPYKADATSVIDVPADLAAEECAIQQRTVGCRPYAFVSSPPAMPLTRAFSVAGLTGVRLLAAAGAVAAMAICWRRSPSIELAAAVGLVTLLMFTATDLGQTSPILMLAVALPFVRRPWAEPLAGVVLAVVAALKGFPIVVVAVPLVARRRWLVVPAAATLAGLAAVAAVNRPLEVWGDFVAELRSISASTAGDAYNGALLAVSPGVTGKVAWLAVAGCTALVWRRADYLGRWALVWAALPVLFPQVWGHYLLAGFAAVALVGRRWMPPVAALLTVASILAPEPSIAPTIALAAIVMWGMVVVTVVQDAKKRPTRPGGEGRTSGALERGSGHHMRRR